MSIENASKGSLQTSPKNKMISKRSKLPALANNDMVALFHTETRGYVGWDVRMSLLVPTAKPNVNKKRYYQERSNNIITTEYHTSDTSSPNEGNSFEQ